MPFVCDTVYAVLVVSDRGEAGLTYWALARGHGLPLVLLDWEKRQMLPDLWRSVSARLEELVPICRARFGSCGIFSESLGLTNQGQYLGHHVSAIPEWLTQDSGWPSLTVAAMQHVVGGNVTRSATALEKAHPVYSFAGGDRPKDDPITPSYMYGIVCGLDHAAAVKPKPPDAPIRIVV